MSSGIFYSYWSFKLAIHNYTQRLFFNTHTHTHTRTARQHSQYLPSNKGCSEQHNQNDQSKGITARIHPWLSKGNKLYKQERGSQRPPDWSSSDFKTWSYSQANSSLGLPEEEGPRRPLLPSAWKEEVTKEITFAHVHLKIKDFQGCLWGLEVPNSNLTFSILFWSFSLERLIDTSKINSKPISRSLWFCIPVRICPFLPVTSAAATWYANTQTCFCDVRLPVPASSPRCSPQAPCHTVR